MIIILDIGNTAVTYGIYDNDSRRMLECSSSGIDALPKIIKKSFENGGTRVHTCLISSVVPKNTQLAVKSLKKFKTISVKIVGRDISIPVKSNYRQKNKLGIDRTLNIYGALQRYQAPLLVIDAGTAITVDFVSKKRIFEGGMIIPGPEIAFRALIDRAALLPKNLSFPSKTSGFIGQTTEDCMNSGILEGYGAMLDGLIERFRTRYGENTRAIMTGGYSHILKSFCEKIDAWDPNLSIQALLLLHRSTVRKK
jgi:type III pantothenate kinase